MESARPRVVVLGGGLVGTAVVHALEKTRKFAVTVIDRREYFENNIANVRAVVDPVAHATVPHASWADKSTKFILGEAVDVDLHSVRVRSADSQQAEIVVPFDFLVVATGSSYDVMKSTTAKLADRRQFLQRAAEQIKNAKSVLIVGGGPVGVELLGEIVSRYPGKAVTLVHGGPRLLSSAPEKAHRELVARIGTMRNVKLILNDRLVTSVPRNLQDERELKMATYSTKNGVEVSADLVFAATGATPNSQALRPHFSGALDPAGWVTVNKFLQVSGCENIFAAGDVAAAPHLKLAYNACRLHVPVVTENLLALAARKAPKAALDSSKAVKWPVITSVGPEWGVMVAPIFGGSTFSGGLPSKLKNGVMKAVPSVGKDAI